jgi:hypothetical protein
MLESCKIQQQGAEEQGFARGHGEGKMPIG